MKRLKAFLGSSTVRWTRRLVLYPLALLAAVAIGNQFPKDRLFNFFDSKSTKVVIHGSAFSNIQQMNRVVQQGTAKVQDRPKNSSSTNVAATFQDRQTIQTKPTVQDRQTVQGRPLSFSPPPIAFRVEDRTRPSDDSRQNNASRLASLTQQYSSTPDASKREELQKQMLDVLLVEFNASQSMEREKLTSAKQQIKLWENTLDKRDTMKREIIESQLFKLLQLPVPLDFDFRGEKNMNLNEPTTNQTQLDAYWSSQSAAQTLQEDAVPPALENGKAVSDASPLPNAIPSEQIDNTAY